ncbi:MAG: hypothetical protein ACLSHU_13525 [Oscillospiraceae bacterium]
MADIPAINPAVLSVFQDRSWTGVLDIGGDPIGARVLARFAPQIQGRNLTFCTSSMPTGRRPGM